MTNPWDNHAWRANVQALQAQLIMLVAGARKVGCSLEYLKISEDEEDTLEAVGLEAAPLDGYPERAGVFARFFPDHDLLEEGGPVPDAIYEAYFPATKSPE